MKNKVVFSLLFLLFIGACSSDESSDDQNNNPITEENELLITKGLGKSSEEFVSNWNKLVSTISEDEQTTSFFSINPDEVKWTSIEKKTLYFEFGNIENPQNVFVINLNINQDSDTVTEVEFFAPTSKDEISSQQSKLFFSISDFYV